MLTYFWTNFKNLYRRRRKTALFLLLIIFLAILWVLPPANFPTERIVRIEKGMNISQAGEYLKKKKVIQSPLLFKLAVLGLPGRAPIIAGDYMLRRRITAFGLAYRLVAGDYEIEPVKVRVPEGATLLDISIILANRIPEFNQREFLSLASTSEGFLFPDTYFFLPTASTSLFLEEMRENFDRQTASLRADILKSDKSLHEVVTMASILEKEAYDSEDRRLIAGVLWKRIEAGMRLQVDAVFPYFLGKNTFQLTKADLNYDSPYNTYRYAGLPPGPIGSPSLDTITAALKPIESPYWFYLADFDGVTHYAVNFEDHVENKRQYLR
ncbi:MAG: hypothetical protein COV09_01950 [Candidatus Vogelbacteria bacterium CG10_big_fil_rev_8_21_14_0_10_50_13]|uniref:Endolytic murein transglycosylase n=1 Tax=Candidatus Vogelbacteria bacterium CG10_big_fil_rev_8_21_14_0_10_50_13 TaxID=1975044 RepID=A0A2H0RHT2_9BACT|nr:MAG: hypothetical protein COV09_01950 [Candidatus Vogelbacteria bacterium CG10_big_fil_rev_8_21_14_0_10_50_13]